MGEDVTPIPKGGGKKRSAKAIVAEADRLFSLRIRTRDGRCQNCGTTRDLQCAHGFSRSYRTVRWDDRNAFALCRGCHVKYTHRPIEWDDWLRERMGDELYDEVRLLASLGPKPDVAAVLEQLKGKAA